MMNENKDNSEISQEEILMNYQDGLTRIKNLYDTQIQRKRSFETKASWLLALISGILVLFADKTRLKDFLTFDTVINFYIFIKICLIVIYYLSLICAFYFCLKTILPYELSEIDPNNFKDKYFERSRKEFIQRFIKDYTNDIEELYKVNNILSKNIKKCIIFVGASIIASTIFVNI